MSPFHRLLGIALLGLTANNFVWFALIFWAYLTTRSVISTSVIAGIFLVITAVSGFWFGSIVDHNKKKHAMLGSSIATFILFSLGLTIYQLTPESTFTSLSSMELWVLVIVLLSGTLVGTIYNIAIPTLVAILVPEDRRDKANGLFGTTVGIGFAITSLASGVGLAYGGMSFVISVSLVATLAVILLLTLLPIPEKGIIHVHHPEELPTGETGKKKVDVRGTITIVKGVPGLFALIFFTTFNNFIGGIFFALMDAYGLTLVSVEVWGFLWGVLSLSFIAGGIYIAKKGLTNNPLRILFRNNYICWTVCIFFTIQPSIILLAIGTFIWMFFVPFIEAIEQTIFQKVVPLERLGRVIGFAHSIEQAASPVTAFLIGPIAQLVFIPFMTTGAGVELIGDWYGTGVGRGIALVFTTAGIIGLIVTIIAKRSRAATMLSERIMRNEESQVPALSGNGNDAITTNGNIHSSSYVFGDKHK